MNDPKAQGARPPSAAERLPVTTALRAAPHHRSWPVVGSSLAYMRDAQVMILDDIGPFLAASAGPDEPPVQALERLLKKLLGPVRAGLAMRSTIWLLGPDGSGAESHLADMATAIGDFLDAQTAPLGVALRLPKEVPTPLPAGPGALPERVG